MEVLSREKVWAEEWIDLTDKSAYDADIYAQLVRAAQAVWYTAYEAYSDTDLYIFDLSDVELPQASDVIYKVDGVEKFLCLLWNFLYVLSYPPAELPILIDEEAAYWGEPGTIDDDPPGYLAGNLEFVQATTAAEILAYIIGGIDYIPDFVNELQKWKGVIELYRDVIDDLQFVWRMETSTTGVFKSFAGIRYYEAAENTTVDPDGRPMPPTPITDAYYLCKSLDIGGGILTFWRGIYGAKEENKSYSYGSGVKSISSDMQYWSNIGETGYRLWDFIGAFFDSPKNNIYAPYFYGGAPTYVNGTYILDAEETGKLSLKISLTPRKPAGSYYSANDDALWDTNCLNSVTISDDRGYSRTITIDRGQSGLYTKTLVNDPILGDYWRITLPVGDVPPQYIYQDELDVVEGNNNIYIAWDITSKTNNSLEINDGATIAASLKGGGVLPALYDSGEAGSGILGPIWGVWDGESRPDEGPAQWTAGTIWMHGASCGWSLKLEIVEEEA